MFPDGDGPKGLDPSFSISAALESGARRRFLDELLFTESQYTEFVDVALVDGVHGTECGSEEDRETEEELKGSRSRHSSKDTAEGTEYELERDGQSEWNIAW